jgi:hypothetical protein
MCSELAGPRERKWVNLGGQLAADPDVEALLAGIRAGQHHSWPQIHRAYDALWAAYPLQKQRHALATLLDLLGTESPADRATEPLSRSEESFADKETARSAREAGVGQSLEAAWNAALDEAVRIQEYVRDQVFCTRQKDYTNRFRQTTFRNAAEMRAVVGTAEENSFVKQVRKETEEFKQLVESVKHREHAATRC